MKLRIAKTGNWVIWALAIAGVCSLGIYQGFMQSQHHVNATQISTQTPGLTFKTQKIQLAEVRAGVPLTCHFSFTNSGPNAIEITELRPGCGCLRPRLDQLRFGPGASGSLPVELQTLGQPSGPHTWHLGVVYRDGNQVREQALQVAAIVVIEVSVQPTSLTLLTQGTLSHEITVMDSRTEPLKILQVDSSTPYLVTEASPFARDPMDLQGRLSAKIKVRSTANLPAGRFEEQLVIHTSDPIYKEFKIPVTIVKEAARRVTAMPAELTLPSTRLVRLRDTMDQPVVIGSVTSDEAALSFHWASGLGNQVTLKVTLDDTALKSGSTGATIVVQIASPEREVLHIPVRWQEK